MRARCRPAGKNRMAEIFVAKLAGFCFGVKNAVDAVERAISTGKRVFTLGKLIHNPFYIASLEEKASGSSASPISI